MSDTPQVQAAPTNVDTILGRIESAIVSAQAEGVITDQVVNVFTAREINKRSDLLVKGFDQLATTTKAYGDINKPDMQHFTTADPAEKGAAVFSPKRRQEIAAAKKKLDKITTAINNAVFKADYAGLEKALKGGDKDDE